ncbi:hypothetical protein BJ944DRAFT_284676 [Cunninghamella echinulata]|nr:hypothetical protein BJ944DRAFT_284676 [Cunninghamella echinulata]
MNDKIKSQASFIKKMNLDELNEELQIFADKYSFCNHCFSLSIHDITEESKEYPNIEECIQNNIQATHVTIKKSEQDWEKQFIGFITAGYKYENINEEKLLTVILDLIKKIKIYANNDIRDTKNISKEFQIKRMTIKQKE